MAAYTDAVPHHVDVNGDPITDSGSVEGWSPGICSWCDDVMLVTELVRGERRTFCRSCLDKLAATSASTKCVAQDGQHLV